MDMMGGCSVCVASMNPELMDELERLESENVEEQLQAIDVPKQGKDRGALSNDSCQRRCASSSRSGAGVGEECGVQE